MSENTDHESGGVLVDNDVITEGCANVKSITIQSAVPSTIYEGMVWLDTDDDPPQIRHRDATNTEWVTRPGSSYASEDVFTMPVTDKVTNGMIKIQYDSGLSKTVFWGISNGGWTPLAQEA